MEHEHIWEIIEGVYLDPLLGEECDVANKFYGLEPGIQARAAFEETLQLLASGSAFWIDRNSGSYLEQAPAVLYAVRSSFEAVFQAAEFADPRALVDTIRTFTRHSIEGPDSALVATWAMALAADALTQLWEAQQLMQSSEQDAALIFAEMKLWHDRYLEQAKAALLTAETHLHYEQEAGSPGGLYARSTLDAAAIVHAQQVARQASARARVAGKGNKDPESVRQKQVAANRGRIHEAANRVISGRPGISFTTLISVLSTQGIASSPTLRKHLAHLKPKRKES